MDNIANEQSKNNLLTNKDWGVVDGEYLLATDFVPLAGSEVKNNKAISLANDLPYASVSFECKKIKGKIKGYITNKMDFINLWTAFRERGIKQNEEVIIVWSRNHYKYKILKLLNAFLPKLRVMICRENTHKIIMSHDLDFSSHFKKGRFIITEWKPEVFK